MMAGYRRCRWWSLLPVVVGTYLITYAAILSSLRDIWFSGDIWVAICASILIAGGILLFCRESLWSHSLLRVYLIAALMSVALEMYLRFLAPTPPTGQGDGPVTSALMDLTMRGIVLTAYLLPHQYTDPCCYDKKLVFVGFAREWLVGPLATALNAILWAFTSAIVIFVYRSVRRKTPSSPTI